MKFRRKPIVRDTVDAIKLTESYTFVDADGVQQTVPHAEFEAAYEAVTRAPRAKKKSGAGKGKRGNGQRPLPDTTRAATAGE